MQLDGTTLEFAEGIYRIFVDGERDPAYGYPTHWDELSPD